MRFEGKIAEMLVKMDPKMYGKYVEDENILTTGASQTKGSMENNVRYCGMLKT